MTPETLIFRAREAARLATDAAYLPAARTAELLTELADRYEHAQKVALELIEMVETVEVIE